MRIIYSHPADNLIEQAAVTVAVGTPLDGYGVENLNDGTLAHPFKIAETTLDLRFAFTEPVLPEFPVLANSNLTVAAVLEGSDAPGGAADVTLVFGIPVQSAERVPLYSSPFGNLLYEYAKQYWRLLVTGNGAPIIIGAMNLGSTYRIIDSNYDVAEGSTLLTSKFRTISKETGFGIDLAYRQAARREQIDGSVVVSLAEFAALEAWHQACAGGSEPAYMVPDDGVNDAWYVRLDPAGFVRGPYGPGGWRVKMPVRQLSPGLGW